MNGLWSAEDLVTATGGRLLAPFEATGVAIDTRKLVPGEMFVALKGDRRDGHDFVAEAVRRGASGMMVERVPENFPTDAPLLVVPDTLAGLTALGAYGRARSFARVFAVTGSVGKTTTKEMLRLALSGQARVHAAEASYNNHLGVPLTLARLPRDAQAAVVEIGMNHPGEIAPLARLVRPHVAIITAIASAHIGHLGSLEAIAEEKATIFSGLLPDGVAVIPADTPFLPVLLRHAGKARVLRFGESGEARLLSFSESPEGSVITAEIAAVRVRFRLPAAGRHLAMNALAALAAVAAGGFDVTAAAEALEQFQPVPGRGARRWIALPRGGKALLMDESYNASPASMRAALAVLALSSARRRVAVLGDMLELGAFGPAEHAGLAAAVEGAADIVFACGPLMRHLFDAISPALRGAYAPDAKTLAPIVAGALLPEDAVLVKASQGSAMHFVIAALSKEPD